MRTIILNKSNIVEGSNNSLYKYKFPSTVEFKSAKVAISKIAFYYSWANVTKNYNNNSFSYQWFDLSGNLSKTYSLTIPDGYYTYSDINSWMYEELCNRGHFLTYPVTTTTIYGTSNGLDYTSSTKYVFFEIQENATYYSSQITLYALPNFSATPVYNTIPIVTGYSWRTPTAISNKLQTGKIVIPSSTSFSDYIGFSSGTIGTGQIASTVTREDLLSDKSPELVPVSSVLVLNSLISNKFASSSNLAYSFSATVEYGALIDVEPNNLVFLNVVPGLYNDFTIQLKDQDFGQMYIKDKNNIIILILDEHDD